ncbi:MAG: hypothetical protein OHK0053_28760 [Microscillaceae bacterium]
MSLNKIVKSMITLGVLFVPGYWAYKWFFDSSSENPPLEQDKPAPASLPTNEALAKPVTPSAIQEAAPEIPSPPATSEKEEETLTTKPESPAKIEAASEPPVAEGETEYYNGKPVFVGAKGGKYYLSDTGRKIYIREEE